MAVETQTREEKRDFSKFSGFIRVIFYEEISPKLYRYKGERKINTLKLVDRQVHFKKSTFILDTAFVTSFDKTGSPIVEYDIGKGTPLVRGFTQSDNGFGRVPSSKIWYSMFKLQKYKALLSSVSKEKAPAPWYIYVLMGAMIGVVAAIIAYPYIFPNNVIHTAQGIIQK